ncbi:MAG: hypothetical protein IJB61_09525, partial [Bacteroides sp]|nr:hypothetical protein [Bacteroides sp.]
MKKTCLISIAMLALLFATSCNTPVAQKPQVKNVIYLIGDGYLGVDPDGKPLTSILRKAQAMGKRSGIVVNTVLTEAT